MSKLISVVVPVFNEEAGVVDLLETELLPALSEIKYDFEIVMVNDGSTDKTKVLIESCQDENHNVRIVSYEKNMGAGYARNRGIELSRGKYLWFVDSDDFIDDVRFDENEAYKLGVHGVPYFVIDDKYVIGGCQTKEEIKQTILKAIDESNGSLEQGMTCGPDGCR
jgi:glycosyltransferase involved in cell wall biosynthesis